MPETNPHWPGLNVFFGRSQDPEDVVEPVRVSELGERVWMNGSYPYGTIPVTNHPPMLEEQAIGMGSPPPGYPTHIPPDDYPLCGGSFITYPIDCVPEWSFSPSATPPIGTELEVKFLFHRSDLSPAIGVSVEWTITPFGVFPPPIVVNEELITDSEGFVRIRLSSPVLIRFHVGISAHDADVSPCPVYTINEIFGFGS